MIGRGLIAAGVCALVVSAIACGGDDAATSAAAAGATAGTSSQGVGGAGAGGSPAAGSGGMASSSSGGGAGGTPATGSGGGGGGSGGAPPVGLESLGALVVLGDSISDGGGQGPFYYNLLKADLEAKYGPIVYQNKAESGSKTGALVGQINDLPNTLPGPVAVAITSGGNDMKDALPQIITGTDATKKQQMRNNVKAALDALLVPGKFGAGVEVHVFEGNIYDASAGVGDFGQNGCNFGNGLPAIPTDAFFDAWNGVIADEVAAHGQVSADMHAHFYDHGYAGSPSWFAPDCTHPNMLGHSELRKLFYLQITGEALP